MTKPFQLTNEMQKEMVDGLTALAPDPQTHDAAGQMFGAPRLRRRQVHMLSGEGDAQESQNDTALSGEESIRAEIVAEDLSIEQVLTQRGTTHGDFTDNARISQMLKDS